MAAQDSNIPENSSKSAEDEQRAVEEELQASLEQIKQLQTDYEALTDQQKAALPESFRHFFEGT